MPDCWCTIDIISLQEEIAKDLLSGDYEEETQSSADDLTPSVTSHEATDFFPRTLRCKWHVPLNDMMPSTNYQIQLFGPQQFFFPLLFHC